MKKLLSSVMSLAVVLSLAACNTNNGALDNNNNNRPFGLNQTLDRNRTDMGNRPWDNRFNNGNVTGSHSNTRLELSEEIADQIAAMDEVDEAYVLLTNRNCYVAVDLNDRANVRGNNNRGTNGHGGMTRDLTRNTGDANGFNRGNRLGVTDNRFGGDRVDNGVTGSEVEFGTYGNGQEVSSQLKQKIASKVKSINSKIENVYVSADPDFVDRMNGYIQNLQQGRPVRGFIDEFNTMVERIFPTNATDLGDRDRDNRMMNR